MERDRLIMHLRGRGYSRAEIASYLGMTQPAIHYALQRLSGTPKRKPVARDLCDGCWDEFRVDELDQDGVCSTCQTQD